MPHAAPGVGPLSPPAPEFLQQTDDLPAADPDPPVGRAVETPSPAYYDDSESIAYGDEERSRFEYEPPFRPRRNPARVWTIAAALFAVVALAATGAVWWYGLPDWAPIARPTFAEAQPDLVLEFPAGRQDRRSLPDGTQYFGASGTITNIGQTRRSVPSILIVLRDARDRIVYSAVVNPPKRTLGPGERVTINEALTDVPRSATAAEIGWKPG